MQWAEHKSVLISLLLGAVFEGFQAAWFILQRAEHKSVLKLSPFFLALLVFVPFSGFSGCWVFAVSVRT